jgi:transposase-like protein
MNDFLDVPLKVKLVPVRPARYIRKLHTDDFPLRAKVAIVQRGTNVSEIARAIGRSRVATSEAINHGLHEPTRRLVAQHLGIAA